MFWRGYYVGPNVSLTRHDGLHQLQILPRGVNIDRRVLGSIVEFSMLE